MPTLHQKYLICPKHHATRQQVIQVMRSLARPENREAIISLMTTDVSTGTNKGPFITFLSMGTYKHTLNKTEQDPGRTIYSFGKKPNCKDACYIVRALVIALDRLMVPDYVLSLVISFVIGERATAAFEYVTTTGIKTNEKDKKAILKKHKARVSLDSLVIATRKTCRNLILKKEGAETRLDLVKRVKDARVYLQEQEKTLARYDRTHEPEFPGI